MAVDPEFEALIAKFEETAKTRNETVKSGKTNPEDEISRWIKKRKSEISLMDFRIKAKLGQGAFGSVFLVQLMEPDD